MHLNWKGKLSLPADDAILYIKPPKIPPKKLLELINEFIKVVCVYIYIYIYIYIYKFILFSLEIEGNPAVCDSMGEPIGHYVKWDKPDREKQMLHDLTYMGNKKNWIHRNRE